MSTATQELELVAPDESAQVDNMKRADVGSVFKAFESEAAPILEQAKALVVTDASQLAVMKVADEYRKQIKKHRCAVEVRRKELVEGLNKQTSEINTAARTIREKFEEAEQRLLEISEFAEREMIRIEDGKREARCAELKPFLTGPLSVDLGKISDEEYGKMLADAKDLATLREERARKEKEAVEAKARVEAEERERIRLDNERLKKEAEEREAAARKEREETAERERVAKEKADAELARVKAEAEQRALEEAELRGQRVSQLNTLTKAPRTWSNLDFGRMPQEEFSEVLETYSAAHHKAMLEEAAEAAAKEAAEKKAAADRKKAKEDQDRRDAIAKQEREAAEAKAREEREKFEVEAKRQRQAREKAEAELAAKDAIEKKQKAEQEAKEKAAALAPAKEKLMAFAKEVRLLALKTFSVPSVELITEVSEKTESFAKWIEKKASAL